MKSVMDRMTEPEDQQSCNAHLPPGPVQTLERETLQFNMHTAPGHGHTTTCYKFWQHFKAFIIPIILCMQLQKDPFCLIILYYILFYFIHVYIAPGQGKRTLGDNFFDGSRKVLSLWSLVACFKKYLCPQILCTFFMILYIHIASTGADNPFSLMSTERPHHFNVWFYTHLFMI